MPVIHSFPPSAESLREACLALKQGRLIALATETVFGVAADAQNLEAIAALYAAKGRAASVPLQVLVPDLAAAEALGAFTDTARKLAEHFWPGALTLVVPLRTEAMLAPNLLAGGTTIGIRIPDHATAQALLRAYGTPIAASSANRSGGAPARSAQEAAAALTSHLTMILDGPCDLGEASTVVGIHGEILREGKEAAAIRQFLEDC